MMNRHITASESISQRSYMALFTVK